MERVVEGPVEQRVGRCRLRQPQRHEAHLGHGHVVAAPAEGAGDDLGAEADAEDRLFGLREAPHQRRRLLEPGMRRNVARVHRAAHEEEAIMARVVGRQAVRGVQVRHAGLEADAAPCRRLLQVARPGALVVLEQEDAHGRSALAPKTLEAGHGERGVAAEVDDRLLPGRDRGRRLQDLRHMRRRHGDGAVGVGVDQGIGARVKPGHVDLAAEIHPVIVGAVGRDAAVEHLKALGHAGHVADGAVGDEADAAERAVHEAHHLAEERVGGGVRGVGVLHQDDAGPGAGRHVVEPGEVLRPRARRVEASPGSMVR